MLTEKTSVTFRDVDFMFENSLFKVVADRNFPETDLVGIKVGPFKEGKEYEVQFWIAEELEKAGIVHFREEDMLDSAKLYKIHWKERIQSVRSVATLPEDFYPKLRRYLLKVKKEGTRNPEKMREHDKAVRLAQDVVNCRLKKIVSLASTPTKAHRLLQNLTVEERALYERLYNIINEWRNEILKVGCET